ncbi:MULTISPECIES: hypothetical protein [Prochlorococcus]|uniref:hypothetical protein n=1 Tax=Prochlorococcus TaxID=1218 RepID=UPI00187CB171|nr:hypothetical protein [Prochlorococcus marinus]
MILGSKVCLASSDHKKNIYDLIHKTNYSLNRTLLVQSDENIKEITISGRGKSEEQAAMNAAKNALLMASPRYIKKRRVSLYKETVINDNLIKEESQDSYRESSYGFNQGSILAFKIIKSSMRDNLYSVVAKAKVSYGLNEQEFHPLFKPSKVSTKELGIQKIFKIGVGFTEEDAINDAIEQALIFIAGEKINVETNLDVLAQLTSLVDKELEENDLYTKETLGDLTSGYSEGYIESFKKLNSYEEDGLFKVEADILVRNKTFSSYIDEKLMPSRIKIIHGK